MCVCLNMSGSFIFLETISVRVYECVCVCVCVRVCVSTRVVCVGEYPVEAVQMMASICVSTERAIDYHALFLGRLALITTPLSRIESLTSAGRGGECERGRADL